jgi:threonylcarbamoyladenosine tRNA methylthiotransferase MtaB
MSLYNKKIWVHSLGCRTNQSEKESVASGLVEQGAVIEKYPQNSDVAVIFTCSVTSVADKKSRQCIRMARRNIPDGIIIACGCWAQQLKKEEAKELGIDFVIGNRQKHLILKLLESLFNMDKPKYDNGRSRASCASRHLHVLCNEKNSIHVIDVWDANQVTWDKLPVMKPVTRSRAFIKIQDGCNRFCSYCIVPFLRGRPVSRPLDDVINEIQNVVAAGCKEIVLTGTNLGDYSCELGDISALVEEISKMSVKLQFGSIEPFSIKEDFLNAVHKLSNENRFSPPLHIPLQSGDDSILSRMKRGYTSSEYLLIIENIKKKLGEILISTDLIVGFPGETEEAFQNSVDVIKKVGFCKVHVFPYSVRKNTLAASFEDNVSKEIILRRVNRISMGDEDACNL